MKPLLATAILVVVAARAFGEAGPIDMLIAKENRQMAKETAASEERRANIYAIAMVVCAGMVSGAIYFGLRDMKSGRLETAEKKDDRPQ